jgi:hypothetical protein
MELYARLPRDLQSVTLIRHKDNFHLFTLKLLFFRLNLFLAADTIAISLLYIKQAREPASGVRKQHI